MNSFVFGGFVTLLVLLSLCRRTPTGSNNAPPMLRDFHKLWQKSQLYHKNDTFLRTLEKVLGCWQRVRQIPPITHVISYIWGSTCKHSASSLHNNQMAVCWQCNWWNFTENRFRLWTSRYFLIEKKVPSLALIALIASLGVITLQEDVD